MKTQVDPDYRFGGIKRLYGEEGFERLRSSHVMVIGLGGVGSWAAEALARAGLGQLTLIDFDEVCLSNTNRQLHALTQNVGKMKAPLMAERLNDINPDLSITARDEFFDQDSCEEFLSLAPDFIIDAIDSLDSKCLLISQCRARGLKLFVSGGAGGLTDPTQIQVTDLARSFADPLLHSVRKRLRQDFGFPRGDKKFGISCVFSAELPYYPQEDGSVTKDPAKKPKRRLDCHGGLGTATPVTGSFGFVAAAQVIQALVVASEEESTPG